MSNERRAGHIQHHGTLVYVFCVYVFVRFFSEAMLVCVRVLGVWGGDALPVRHREALYVVLST